MTQWQLEWPFPAGNPQVSGQLKSRPEDFRVTELLDDGGPFTTDIDATVPGAGEHLLLYLEKCGDNTPWVARQLGELAGCGDSGVGYCGLKDRNAVTRQWFSVQRPGLESGDGDLVRAVQQQWPVLALARRSRKLRRGDHQGNRFEIYLRDLQGDLAELSARLASVAADGCPNYFGRQRFGHHGSNLDRAIAMTAAPRGRGRRRGRRGGSDRNGMALSAARSWLFNQVLAERVACGTWNQLMDGEPQEGVPTGPLWGDGGTRASGAQEALEREVVSRWPDIEAVFADSRMAPERRPLILAPTDLDWQLGENWLSVAFTLVPGQYATALLSCVLNLREDLPVSD